MLDREELEVLENFKSEGELVVSLFIGVSPQDRKRSGYISKFKNLVKALDEKKASQVKEDIEKIERFLQGERESFKKFLVLYSCIKKGLWRRYDLNVELKDELIVDNTPYTNPLIDVLSNYQKYGVLLVDKRSARVFLVFLGEIEEYGMVEHDHVPGKHKKGGWFALAEKRFERHIEHHIQMHLKEVIDKFGEFLKDREIRNLILAGPDEAIYELMKILPESIKQKIVGRTFIEKHASSEEILMKVMPIIEDYERAKENRILSELLTRASKNENAVIGIDDVLKYLREKRVNKLILPKDYRIEGSICPSCGFATHQEIEVCLSCRGKLMKGQNLIERVTEMALQNGVSVEVIKNERDRNLLIENSGIGALLRF